MGREEGEKDLNSVHQKPKRQALLFFLACHVTRRLQVDRRLVAGITHRPSYLGIRTVKTPGVLEQKQRRLTIVQRREQWLHGGWAAWRRTRWKEFHPQAVWCCSKRQRHVKPFSKAQLLGKGCRQKHTQAFFGVRSKNAPSAVLTSFGALCLSSDLLLSVFHHLSNRQPVHRSTRFVTRENGRDSRNTPTETGKTPTPKLSRPLHLFSIPKGQLA